MKEAKVDKKYFEKNIEKKAKLIASMGLIDRTGPEFRVSNPASLGSKDFFRVRRGVDGLVCCSCPKYKETVLSDPTFRCEHIQAIKYGIALRNTESSVRPPSTTKAGSTKNSGGIPNCEPSPAEPDSRQELETADNCEVSSFKEPAVSDCRQQFSKKPKIFQNKKGAKPMIDTGIDRKLESPASQPANVLDFAGTLNKPRRADDPQDSKADHSGNALTHDYLEWRTVAEMLDEAAPLWSNMIRDIRQIGDVVTVTAAITIDGVTREDVGTGSAGTEMGIRRAEQEALKNAALKFGIARNLYQRGSRNICRDDAARFADDKSVDFPDEPVARSFGEMITATQLGMIRAVARETRIDPEKECRALLHCEIGELSNRAASSLLRYLRELPRESPSEMRIAIRRAS